MQNQVLQSNITLGKKVTYKDQYDPSILFPINREERRKEYKHKMYGVDVWTCYEVSYLLQSGLPQFMVLRIVNPADSVNIFESKSLKLYLNSFNNTKFDSKEQVIETIKKDLDKLTGGDITVVEIRDRFIDQEYGDATVLENEVQLSDQEFVYNYDPSLLKTTNESVSEVLESNLLRSNCEITNQPDWARIRIYYKGKKKIDHESLLRYIVSYRKHQEFHEPTCERIYQDLYKILEPEHLTVQCNYTRRGGIDINPIRSSDPIDEFEAIARNVIKTLQQ